jgi:transposase-like protein
MNQRYSEAQRRHLFEEQQRTGEPLRAVARRLGIHEAAAYEWARRKKLDASKPTPLTAVSFAQVVRATPTLWLVVEVGRAVIRVPKGFDAEHLRHVVQALSEEPRS